MIKQSLNGIWKYRIGDGEWGVREVPFSALAVGHSECERAFDLEYTSPRVELILEGITYEATVILNGVSLGKMLPYCEYTFDITDTVKHCGNLLRVELEDMSPAFGPVAGWENFGGIIRDVYIRYGERERIRDVFFHSELENGYRDAVGTLELSGECTEGCLWEITLCDGENTVLSDRIGAEMGKYSFKLEGVKTWSPDAPNLYEMQIKLLKNGEIKDEYIEKIGFRELKCDRHKFLLNGKPLFLRGVCKHEMVADLGHTVPKELTRRDMEMIKSLGCNFVRLVHYPHAKAVLDIADGLGLLVSEEPGLWWSDTANESIASGSLEVLKRTILRDRNRPSVAFWLCFNECVFTEKFLIDSARVCKETDPTRLVSGANCMSDEDTLKYYNACGFDFYTMHPYSQTFDKSQRSARVLHDKPLVFTEWGGHFVYNNPKLMREFIHGMRHLYENASDDGALAGAFLWCFAEVNDFNREWPAVRDGRLLEGLVDYNRCPRACYEVFKTAWDEDLEDGEYKFKTLGAVEGSVTPFNFSQGGASYGELHRSLWCVPKPQFLEEQRPRRIKVGPVCKNADFPYIERVPRVLCDAGYIEYRGGGVFDGVVILGGVSATLGYPISGSFGEVCAALTVRLASGERLEYPLRNGIEVTTVYSTYRSSRIDPIASRAPRFMEFSYDGSFERFVMNKIDIAFDSPKEIVSVSLASADAGYALLTYAALGYRK